MSYEDAPATAILATHCAVCHRPLLDAKSVELGIGPVCRKVMSTTAKDISEEARTRANQLVHDVAMAVTRGEPLTELLQATGTELTMLGFVELANKLTEGTTTIRIRNREDGTLAIHAPYREDAIMAWNRISAYWDKRLNARIAPKSAKRKVWAVLKRYFPGHTGSGPQGLFTVPEKGTDDAASRQLKPEPRAEPRRKTPEYIRRRFEQVAKNMEVK